MFFPTLRYQDKHKFVIQLKKFLNELVKPSPNLPLDEIVDVKTLSAVRNFKSQWRFKVTTHQYDLDHLNEITPGLWAMIGRALGKDKLLKELREAKDNEIRSLLLGMDMVEMISTYYTSEMENCDAKIASIFGGKNAVAAANGFDPDSLAIVQMTILTPIRKSTTSLPLTIVGRYSHYRGDTIVNGVATEGHLSKQAMHLYGSTDGTRFGVDGNIFTDLYVPDGFEHPERIRKTPSPTSASVDFYYKKLGNYQDVTLLVSHIKDFKLKREGNRWHIGKIGGEGGHTLNYIHSHLDLFKGNVGMTGKRIRLAFSEAIC